MTTSHAASRTAAAIAVTAFAAVAASIGTAAASAPPQDGPVVVAAALTSPRGFTWDADGNLVVALAGSGGSSAPTEMTPTNAVIGPFAGGPTAAVVAIGADGCPTALATGLPSTVSATAESLGAEDVAYLDGVLYVGVDGGGAGHGNADQPSGVYRVGDDGSTELVADLSAWTRANPVAVIPGDSDPDGAGYSLLAGDGVLYVDDPNSGQILTVTPAGEIARLADLSDPHVVPTRLAFGPDGAIYVGTLTTVPFPDGTASVLRVGLDGVVSTVLTGLTAVVDVAVADDGTLYALEMSTGNTPAPPFFTPGSGRIVQQTGADTYEVVAKGLMLPVAMELGADGAFYVATPAIGSNDGSGSVVRVGGDAAATPAGSACTPVAETLAPAAPVGSVPASLPPMDTAAAPDPSEAASTDATTVSIEGFAFVAPQLEIAAGTTVTFVNNDSATHTATADDGSFDTGPIAPGDSATVTFDQPGTFTYACMFHPNMTASITVT